MVGSVTLKKTLKSNDPASVIVSQTFTPFSFLEGNQNVSMLVTIRDCQNQGLKKKIRSKNWIIMLSWLQLSKKDKKCLAI